MGLGLLDQEADSRRGECGARSPMAGRMGQDCFDGAGALYRLGDPNANCTRGNGRRSGGSGRGREPGYAGAVPALVITLDGNSPSLCATARDRHRLLPLPRCLRDPRRSSGRPYRRRVARVRHLRLTVTGGRADPFVLRGMAIVGVHLDSSVRDRVLTASGERGLLLGTGRGESVPNDRGRRLCIAPRRHRAARRSHRGDRRSGSRVQRTVPFRALRGCPRGGPGGGVQPLPAAAPRLSFLPGSQALGGSRER